MASVLINIDVPLLDPAITFYTRAFGLKPKRYFGTGGVELAGAEVSIFLLVKGSGSASHKDAKFGRDYGRHWTPVHLDFVVDDIRAAIARAESAGAVRESDVRDDTWGKLVLFSDPFGNGFCFVEFSARGYDAVSTPAPNAQR